MMLKGIIGALWTFALIPRFVPSRVHLMWLIPLLTLFLIVLLSPSVLCAHFVIRLFAEGDTILACLYAFLLVPGILLGLLMMGISVLAGTREPWWKQEKSAALPSRVLSSPTDGVQKLTYLHHRRVIDEIGFFRCKFLTQNETVIYGYAHLDRQGQRRQIRPQADPHAAPAEQGPQAPRSGRGNAC